ncbi:MAG: hypothetical protein K6T31_08635, partial [Alicyclobacillus sp.]|nr:hypothetical protein [Alicyclobacillus sp.]
MSQRGTSGNRRRRVWIGSACLALLPLLAACGASSSAPPTQSNAQPPSSAAPSAPTAQSTPAQASSATPAPDFAFYNGKTVTLVVATGPGGGYDTYGRLLATYMQKYLPGSTVIVKNVPGAGHIVGANYIYEAKPDGLTLGTFNTGLIISQLTQEKGIKFDLRKFTWIGNAAADTRVLILRKDCPYKA